MHTGRCLRVARSCLGGVGGQREDSACKSAGTAVLGGLCTLTDLFAQLRRGGLGVEPDGACRIAEVQAGPLEFLRQLFVLSLG